MASSQLSILVDNLIANNLIVCNSIVYNLESFTCGFCESASVHKELWWFRNWQNFELRCSIAPSPVAYYGLLWAPTTCRENTALCLEGKHISFFVFLFVFGHKNWGPNSSSGTYCSVFMLPGPVFVFSSIPTSQDWDENFQEKLMGTTHSGRSKTNQK